MATQAVFGALAGFLPLSIYANPTLANASLPVPPSDRSSLSVSIPALILSLIIQNQDVLKFMMIGGLFEIFRPWYSRFRVRFFDSFFITAHFEGSDETFQWMMVWLSRQPIWDYTREVNICTSTWGKRYNKGIEISDSAEDSLENDGSIQTKRKLSYMPAYGTIYWLRYKQIWMSVERSKSQGREMGGMFGEIFGRSREYNENLSIRLFTRDRRVLASLLQDAKKEYRTDDDSVQVYGIGSRFCEWSPISIRKKRPLSSVVLEPDVTNLIMNDAKDFLRSGQWYIDRGIPYRRGYLLYGVPGSGKTSLIHSIAGELGLDIYVVSLAKRGLDDSHLNELIGLLPPRSIALMEDIDAAFLHATARADPAPQTPASSDVSRPNQGQETSQGVTLSGLLGALDGVAAQEGRILFATTNRYHVLDEALCRPGRMDLHIEFKNATTWQARELFRRFFPPDEEVRKTELGTKMVPLLSPGEVDRLAARFADAVPAGQFSMASLQGLLMRFKDSPHEAVEATQTWVEKEILKRGTEVKVQ